MSKIQADMLGRDPLPGDTRIQVCIQEATEDGPPIWHTFMIASRDLMADASQDDFDRTIHEKLNEIRDVVRMKIQTEARLAAEVERMNRQPRNN